MHDSDTIVIFNNTTYPKKIIERMCHHGTIVKFFIGENEQNAVLYLTVDENLNYHYPKVTRIL